MNNQLPLTNSKRRSFAFTLTSQDILNSQNIPSLDKPGQKRFCLPTSNLSSFQINAFNIKSTEANNIRVNSKYSEISTEIDNNTHFANNDSPGRKHKTSFNYYHHPHLQSDNNINSIKGRRLSIKDKLELVKINKENIAMTKWLDIQKVMFLKAQALQRKKEEIEFYKTKTKQFKAQRTEMRRTKLKLHKLLSKEPNQICEDFEIKVIDYNTRLLDYMQQPYYVNQSKTFSEKFHYTKNPIGLAYELTDRIMDLRKGQPVSDLTNKLEHNFTEHERKLIMNDPSYFLSKAKTLTDNPILVKKPLSKLLLDEEVKEREMMEINSGIRKEKTMNLLSMTTQETNSNSRNKNKKTMSFDQNRLYSKDYDANKYMSVIEGKAYKAKENVSKEVYKHHGKRLKEIASGSLSKNEVIDTMMSEMTHEIIHIGQQKSRPYDKCYPIKLTRKEKRESLIMGNQMRLNQEEKNKFRKEYRTEQSMLPIAIPKKRVKKKFPLNNIMKIIKSNLEGKCI